MGNTVSDHVISRLAQWGIRRIYGYPGDGINGLMGALNDDAHGISFIPLTRILHDLAGWPVGPVRIALCHRR